MMARLIALLMLGAAMPACGSVPGDPMAINDVIANIDALNGRTIRVVGYLGDCRGDDCRLVGKPSEAIWANRVHDELTSTAPASLGIGSAENFDFDRSAAPYLHGYVVVTGRVTNACRSNERAGCVGRRPDLVPTRIERWTPPQSQAGNRT